MSVKGIDYTGLEANAALSSTFKSAAKKSILDSKAAQGIPPQDIHVELAAEADSVMVLTTISVPPKHDVASLKSGFADPEAGKTLSRSVANSVSNIIGIQEVRSGPISVGHIRCEEESTSDPAASSLFKFFYYILLLGCCFGVLIFMDKPARSAGLGRRSMKSAYTPLNAPSARALSREGKEGTGSGSDSEGPSYRL